MRHMILAAALFAPLAALAQPAQPVTLSGQEYDALVQAIAQRDPIIAALMHKQAEAQQAAKAAEKPAEAPKPSEH